MVIVPLRILKETIGMGQRGQMETMVIGVSTIQTLIIEEVAQEMTRITPYRQLQWMATTVMQSI